jgi:hypothetical protein
MKKAPYDAFSRENDPLPNILVMDSDVDFF